MDPQTALNNIRNLAKGVHPGTGEVLPTDSPYNDPQIIRSLYTVLEMLPKQKKSLAQRREENRAKGLPENTGLPWSDEGRTHVASGYKEGTPVEALANKHKRSKIAIVAELKRQGIISAEEAAKMGLHVHH